MGVPSQQIHTTIHVVKRIHTTCKTSGFIIQREGGRWDQSSSGSLVSETPWRAFPPLHWGYFLHQLENKNWRASHLHGGRNIPFLWESTGDSLLAHRILWQLFKCHGSPGIVGSSRLGTLYCCIYHQQTYFLYVRLLFSCREPEVMYTLLRSPAATLSIMTTQLDYTWKQIASASLLDSFACLENALRVWCQLSTQKCWATCGNLCMHNTPMQVHIRHEVWIGHECMPLLWILEHWIHGRSWWTWLSPDQSQFSSSLPPIHIQGQVPNFVFPTAWVDSMLDELFIWPYLVTQHLCSHNEEWLPPSQ